MNDDEQEYGKMDLIYLVPELIGMIAIIVAAVLHVANLFPKDPGILEFSFQATLAIIVIEKVGIWLNDPIIKIEKIIRGEE